MKKKSIRTEDFDEKFDKGEDVTEFLDLSKAIRPDQNPKRVNVDFPLWMVKSLDKEAKRVGITRQSVIKYWIAEKIESYSVK